MRNFAYPGEERAHELVNGEAVMLTPATTNHSLISGNIYSIFLHHLKGKRCIAISGGTTVFLTGADHFVPDMMVVCDRSKVKPRGVYGAPDPVVEVISPSTAKNDRICKTSVYAQCGVREYWIVGPGAKTVEVYCSDGSELAFRDVHAMPSDWDLANISEEERTNAIPHFKCSLFDDLDISLEDIFYGTM